MNKDTDKLSNRIGEAVMAVLLSAIAALTLFSWLADVAGWPLSSLLSAEGMRRCFSLFGFQWEYPFHTYILLLVVSCGALQYSGLAAMMGRLLSLDRSDGPITLRQRRALFCAGMIWGIYLGFWTMLLMLFRAQLLSVTGRFFPSPFSRTLPFLLTAGILLASVTYGHANNSIRGWSETLRVCYIGICYHAVWFIDCLLLQQLIVLVAFVFQETRY